MSQVETDTGSGLWAGVFAKLTASLDGLGSHLRNRNTLDAWAKEIPQRYPAAVPVSTTSPNVFAPGTWTPPEGYWWKVRALRLLGPKAANGTELFLSTVNVDLYVTGPGIGNAVPPSGDWVASSGTSATPGGVPISLAAADKEVIVQNGDQVVIVLSGAGVANAAFVASLQVTQYQGLSGMSMSESGA